MKCNVCEKEAEIDNLILIDIMFSITKKEATKKLAFAFCPKHFDTVSEFLDSPHFINELVQHGVEILQRNVVTYE